MSLSLAILLLGVALAAAPAAKPVAEPDWRPTIAIVVGAPGAPEYAPQFIAWAERWQNAADRSGALAFRLGETAAERSPQAGFEGRSAPAKELETKTAAADDSDKKQLAELLAHEARRSASPFWLVLIGHGTYDGQSAKFNLRGEDVTAEELAAWLGPFQRPVVVINCASSSGPFINQLSRADRVVVTATKSGFELNFARFGDHLSAALVDPAADLDKDGQTSLLEAFLLASARTGEFYQQEARLATEQALVDDNGDGRGTPAEWFRGIHPVRQAKDGATLDGARAHQLFLLPSEAERKMPAEVRRRRDELELKIAALRETKGAALDEEAYYAALEPLLVELARLHADRRP